MGKPEGPARHVTDSMAQSVDDRRWVEITLPGCELELKKVFKTDLSFFDRCVRLQRVRPFGQHVKKSARAGCGHYRMGMVDINLARTLDRVIHPFDRRRE